MSRLSDADRSLAERVLAEADAQGFFGPGGFEPHLRHAEVMADLVEPPPGRFVDLGSGGGVPGLVWVLAFPASHALLVESRARPARWLQDAAHRLGVSARCAVAHDRAERLARSESARERWDLVVARAFGSPSAVAECAAPLLVLGGRLVVSEPPEGGGVGRWPADRLAEFGLSSASVRRRGQVSVAIMTKTHATDDRWPRRTGAPFKRPLWSV